jgi:hypothetical protein
VNANNSNTPTSTSATDLLKLVVKAESKFLFVVEKLSRADRVLLDKWINEEDPKKSEFQAWVKLNYPGSVTEITSGRSYFVERICARASFEESNYNCIQA